MFAAAKVSNIIDFTKSEINITFEIFRTFSADNSKNSSIFATQT
jgi:hypothetical protein